MSPLAECYCQHLRSDRSGDALERFLLAHPNLSIVQLVELLLMDQALQWQRAVGPSVEQYLQRFPVVTPHESLVLELVCGELRGAHGLGIIIKAETYEARFPSLTEPLRRQLQLSEWLHMNAHDVEFSARPPE